MALFCQLNEGGGFLADKVRGQFSGSTPLRNTKTFRINTFKVCDAAVYTYDVKARSYEDRTHVDKRHHRTNNKEFLHNMMLRYRIAIPSVIGLGYGQTKYSPTYWI
jgi:hypothetical protein